MLRHALRRGFAGKPALTVGGGRAPGSYTANPDTILKNVKIVRPHITFDPNTVTDIGIKDGKFVEFGQNLNAKNAKIIDGKGMMAFPGVVDAHSHVGIYHPLDSDARSESAAAAQGGVTTSLNYIRAGQYYLNKGGPYSELYPEILDKSKGNYYVDYAYHVAPISSHHISEIETLVTKYGVTSFKIFMFYGSYGLHGRSDSQNEFLMIPKEDKYDISHFEFVMREISAVMKRHPHLKNKISLSLHCELGEILSAYTKIVEREKKYKGLEAYHHARPPHSEGLAIFIASYLANETDCPNINLLHLTSKKAVDAAIQMKECFPHINFQREVTVGHLLLDINAPTGNLAKVNPPIRPREDVEYLWKAIFDGEIDWVCSDHACCGQEHKCDHDDKDNIFKAKSGFGGTEWMLSGMYTEATARGMDASDVARLTSFNPAKRYGLDKKGDIAIGYDADVALFDPTDSFTIKSEHSHSHQGYTPFEGLNCTGRVKKTLLRGNVIYEHTQGKGELIGQPSGKYLSRPY